MHRSQTTPYLQKDLAYHTDTKCLATYHSHRDQTSNFSKELVGNPNASRGGCAGEALLYRG